MILFLSGMCIFLGISLCVSLFYLWRFSRIILNFEDALEDSLEVLDGSFQSIGDVLQRPIFYDSPEVRIVIDEIGKSRDAILYIANRVSNISDTNE